jgi:Tol biopolymer transport system component
MDQPMKKFFMLIIMTGAFSAAHAAEPEVVSFSSTSAFQGSSARPRLSRDGRIVVFETASSLVADDVDRGRDVYIYDRMEKTWERIVARESGRISAGPSISDTGNIVAFHSTLNQSDTMPGPRLADECIFIRHTPAHPLC